MSDWKAVLAGASAQRTLERARKAIGRKTKYELGKGGFDPAREMLESRADCSGFVAWALGYTRELPPGSGRWLSTVEYWNGGGRAAPGAFTVVPAEEAQPGDLYVFPDHAGRQGHIGIISHVENGRPARVIHCSAGNSRAGDAVAETLVDIFAANERVRVVRPNYANLVALAGQPIRVRDVIADAQSGRLRSAAGAVVERPTDEVMPAQGAFDLRNDEIERALHTGDHEGLLEDYFGAAEYRELVGLTRTVRRSAVRGGPKVLLLHGIMGSKLGWDRVSMFDDVIWADPIDIALGRLDQLALPAPNERAAEITPLGVMLFAYLKLKLKLQLAGFDVDFFAYDWRKDIAESGQRLLERLKAEQNASIVAHSMGGLVARWAIRHDAPFKRLIMLGTPNSGSFAPVMAIRATYGVVRKVGWLDTQQTPEALSQRVFGTFPGLLQMLPFADAYETDLSRLESWPDDKLRPQPHALAGVRKLQESLFDGDRENTFVIAGVRRDTAVGMRLLGSDLPPDQRIAYEFSPEGDGTVPLAFGRLENANMYYVEEDHGKLPNNSTVANACIDLLSRGTTSVLPSTYTPRREPPRIVPEIDLRSPAYDLRRDGRLSRREERELISEVAAPDSTPVVISTPPTAGLPFPTGALLGTTGGYAHEFERVVVGRRRQHRLEIRFAQGSITETDTRAIALGTFRDVMPSGAAAAINTRLRGAVRDIMRRRMFTSDVGQVFMLPTGRHALVADVIAFTGLGAFDRLTDETIQIAAENVIRTFINTRVEEFATVLFGAGSGVPIENALHNLLNGFIRGLRDADADHFFRRVVICEQDPERYEQLKREVYRLASTALCEDVELTFDEMVLPAPRFAEEGVRGNDRLGEPVYLQVMQEARKNGDFVVRTSLLTPGAKATVIAENNEVDRQTFERALQDVLDLQTAELNLPGIELGRVVLGDSVRTVLPRFADSHLVIVHDDELARVPWETIAFPRPDGGSPWFPAAEKGITHRYAALNLSVAKWLEERVHDGTLNVLMVVNPTGDLDGAEEEAERVAALLTNIPRCVVNVLRRDEATRPALLQAFSSGRYDVVHYAGHAFFDPDRREQSGILCAGKHVLSGADLVNLANLPSLVFFNACESAKLRRNAAFEEQPDESRAAVQEATGFAEAFMRGGVANFIGTYWPVGDQEANVFATTFYESALRSNSLNEAVQNGRAAVRQLGSRDWANYIFYGDPSFVLKTVAR